MIRSVFIDVKELTNRNVYWRVHKKTLVAIEGGIIILRYNLVLPGELKTRREFGLQLRGR